MGYKFFRYTTDDGSGNPIFRNRDLTQLAIMEKGVNLTTLYGSDAAGDDLVLKANSTDAYSSIGILGGNNIELDAHSSVRIAANGVVLGYINAGGIGVYNIESANNKDIKFTPNGTGSLRFGTYTAGVAGDSTGYITILDAAGNTRKLMVQA